VPVIVSPRAAACGSRKSPTGVDAVGLDWTVNLGAARARGGRVALQGNLDPTCCSRRRKVREQARAVLDSYGNHPGHVFNLGHGISQFTPPENVAVLVDEVHGYSRKLRSGAAG
jgi:uroporphyrinogen decarboxylase